MWGSETSSPQASAERRLSWLCPCHLHRRESEARSLPQAEREPQEEAGCFLRKVSAGLRMSRLQTWKGIAYWHMSRGYRHGRDSPAWVETHPGIRAYLPPVAPTGTPPGLSLGPWGRTKAGACDKLL